MMPLRPMRGRVRRSRPAPAFHPPPYLSSPGRRADREAIERRDPVIHTDHQRALHFSMDCRVKFILGPAKGRTRGPGNDMKKENGASAALATPSGSSASPHSRGRP